MHRPVTASSRRFAVALTAGLLLLGVVGCKGSSGDSGGGLTPGDRLAAAKKSFDAAPFIGFSLSTESLPSGLNGLLSAKGTGTHAPAFIGEVKVQTAIDITAPVVAVDGKVYAKLPFSPYSVIDPAQYGAPDPADLMDTTTGISSLFPKTQSPKIGDSTRDGSTVLTEIDGTLPSDAVKAVFPSAGTNTFDVAYTVTSDNVPHTVKISGPFYDGQSDVTYTISLDLSADSVDIKAP